MDMNDQGMLSIDFLAGFTIFLVGLLIVISMVPGVLVGIRSASIDYDAVAYRTAAILVEDPGWAKSNTTAWEQKDSLHKDDIIRLGLSIGSSRTFGTDYPNILSRNKVEKFFDQPPYFNLSKPDFDEMVLFSEAPSYSYNFSLKIDGEDSTFYVPSGSPIPESRYGYMRRLVMVKNDSYAFINVTEYPKKINTTLGNTTTSSMSVCLNYTLLKNRAIPEPYRIDPSKEPIRIILNNLTGFYNTSDVVNVTFDGVEFWKKPSIGSNILWIPYPYTEWNNDSYLLNATVEGADEKSLRLTPSIPSDPDPYFIYDGTVKNTTQLRLDLLPALQLPIQAGENLLINFTFTYRFADDPTPDNMHHFVGGIHNYDYDNVTATALKPGVLEVFIW